MFTKNLAVLLAVSGVYASPIIQRDECSDKCYGEYNVCRGKPDANRATCASEYSNCLGYLPFDAQGSLVTPTACSQTASATPTPSADACVVKCDAEYDECRSTKPGEPSANQSFCAARYAGCLGYSPFTNGGPYVTPTACSTIATPTPTADACVSKCDAAYNSCRSAPDSNKSTCAAEYSSCLGYAPFNDQGSLVTPTACSTTAAPSSTITSAPVASPAAPAAQGSGWTVKDLIRYCSEDKTGCDYNFKISTNDGQADVACTVVRTNVADAPTESWYGQPCTSGSPFQVSWGYSTQFEAAPFAVLTIVDTTKNAQAYFGVNNPVGQEVTPSNPYGSGHFGDIGPQPVYFN